MNALVDYIPRIMQAVDYIGQGYTKTRACDFSGVSVAVFNKYVGEIPELQVAAVEAFDRHYDTLADALVHIDTDTRVGSTDAKMAAVLSKNIQWYLARRRPKDYGDKLQVDHTVTLDRVITDALDRARQRAETGVVIEGVAYKRLVDGLSPDEHAELAKLF